MIVAEMGDVTFRMKRSMKMEFNFTFADGKH